MLHAPSHLEAGLRIGAVALGLGIAEEDQHRVADELVDGAAEFMGDRRPSVASIGIAPETDS